MAILGFLQKLKRGLGLAFGAHFHYDFSIKMTVDETVDDIINFKIYFGSISKAMADREKKMEDGNTKI